MRKKITRASWLVGGLLLGGGLMAALSPLGWAATRQAFKKTAHTPIAMPIVVNIVKTPGGFHLVRGGKPYFIKGAGGDGSKTELKAAGANSWRTWGVGSDTAGQLAEAQRLGMTITVGIWLGHKDQGFDYSDAAAVAAQKEMARQAILRYRNSPALLVWAVGNEMENGDEGDLAMWNAIEAIAKMSHHLDPKHPTMTVVAEIGGDKVSKINTLCPDIDIVGINSYGGGPSVGERYKAAGGVKPYIITEYGPPGTWESGKNAWGVVPELTSTQKAAAYRATYEKAVLAEPLCLGSYAFTWGHKQEASATWYGLELPDGSHLGAVDTLTQLWSGHKPAYLSPKINLLELDGSGEVGPGATVKATLNVVSPDNDPLTVKWILQADPKTHGVGGETEPTPPTYPDAIVSSGPTSATVKMPADSGSYRLYAYIHDTHGGAAVGNLSLDVQGGAAPPPPAPAQKASLPVTLYSDAAGDTPFVPSGYMGNAGAIKMDPNWAIDPHSGKTCLRVDYTAPDNWGGVVWQNPDNNWGDKPGGVSLSGAKKLTFWARGAKGGEVVSFAFGLIGSDKAFHDTGKGSLDKAVLTKAWKQYTIDTSGQDLSRIVTGFDWSLGATGAPVTFYLDDIQYE